MNTNLEREGGRGEGKRERCVVRMMLTYADTNVHFEDVEHADHLGEEEHTMLLLIQLGEQLVEELHLAAGHHCTEREREGKKKIKDLMRERERERGERERGEGGRERVRERPSDSTYSS
jgi:hypothetical protein